MTDLSTGRIDDHQREAAVEAEQITTPVQLWVAYQKLAATEAALVQAARRMHAAGVSYAALASPFGISRQAARKRWGTEAEQ